MSSLDCFLFFQDNIFPLHACLFLCECVSRAARRSRLPWAAKPTIRTSWRRNNQLGSPIAWLLVSIGEFLFTPACRTPPNRLSPSWSGIRTSGHSSAGKFAATSVFTETPPSGARRVTISFSPEARGEIQGARRLPTAHLPACITYRRCASVCGLRGHRELRGSLRHAA
jgi:hypothetical protein